MKTNLLRSLASLTVAMFVSSAVAHEPGGPLTKQERTYLSQYESIRVALAADDLAAAKKAADKYVATPQAKPANDADAKRATTRLDAGKKLSGASSLTEARDAFKILSRSAVHLAEGQKGYYRYICPHVANDEGKWVQMTKEIGNPYEGKAMPKCGKVLE